MLQDILTNKEAPTVLNVNPVAKSVVMPQIRAVLLALLQKIFIKVPVIKFVLKKHILIKIIYAKLVRLVAIIVMALQQVIVQIVIQTFTYLN